MVVPVLSEAEEETTSASVKSTLPWNQLFLKRGMRALNVYSLSSARPRDAMKSSSPVSVDEMVNLPSGSILLRSTYPVQESLPQSVVSEASATESVSPSNSELRNAPMEKE